MMLGSKHKTLHTKYFLRNLTSLGLDTHDYGLLNEPFEPNMVFTVEQGIYLPDEGFGIRIEDVVWFKKVVTL